MRKWRKVVAEMWRVKVKQNEKNLPVNSVYCVSADKPTNLECKLKHSPENFVLRAVHSMNGLCWRTRWQTTKFYAHSKPLFRLLICGLGVELNQNKIAFILGTASRISSSYMKSYSVILSSSVFFYNWETIKCTPRIRLGLGLKYLDTISPPHYQF